MYKHVWYTKTNSEQCMSLKNHTDTFELMTSSDTGLSLNNSLSGFFKGVFWMKVVSTKKKLAWASSKFCIEKRPFLSYIR